MQPDHAPLEQLQLPSSPKVRLCHRNVAAVVVLTEIGSLSVVLGASDTISICHSDDHESDKLSVLSETDSGVVVCGRRRILFYATIKLFQNRGLLRLSVPRVFSPSSPRLPVEPKSFAVSKLPIPLIQIFRLLPKKHLFRRRSLIVVSSNEFGVG